MEGATEEMKLPVLLALVLVLAAVVLLAAGFLFGRSYARSTMDSGVEPRFKLKDEMVILSSDGAPQGKLPAGTVIYLVPDPFGDRTSLFKAYFQTDIDDMGPIERIRAEPDHPYELEQYGLKSKEWLARVRQR